MRFLERYFRVKSKTFFCGLLFPTLSFGQSGIPDYIPPSPTTVQFQKYGEYPVSHYTGVPDIKIPIYTIKEGDITVPIYLSFHASGLNIDEYSFIGTGWSLQGTGMISRTINGVADEYFGWVDPIPDYSATFESYNAYYTMRDTYHNYYADHQFDVYNYSIPGKSGKFIPEALRYTDDYLDPFQLRTENLFVDLNGIGDENGIGYHFGGEGREEYQEFMAGTPASQRSAVGTWHLATITSSKYPGRGVSYQYQQGRSVSVPVSHEFRVDDTYGDGGAGYPAPYWNVTDYFPHSIPSNNQIVATSDYRAYYPCVPQRITFSDGYLLFVLDGTSLRNLSRIELYDKNNKMLRRIVIEASSFNSNGSAKFRKISAIVFQDENQLEQERYSFNYYYDGALIANSKDYWGFYNGAPSSNNFLFTALPQYYFSYDDYHGYNHGYIPVGSGGTAMRLANAEAAKTFMIQRITYPTGGYTEFDYEGNKNYQGDLVGGLRIREIASYDRNGTLVKKKAYNYNSTGSVEHWFTVQELFLEHSMLRLRGHYLNPNWWTEGKRITQREYPHVPMSAKGSAVGYWHVTETEGSIVTNYYFDDQNAYEYEYLRFPTAYSPAGEPLPYYRIMANHYRPWRFGDLAYKEVKGPGFEYSEGYFYEAFERFTSEDLVMNQSAYAYCYGWCNPEYEERELHTYLGSLYNFAKRKHYSGVKRLVSKSTNRKGSDGLYVSVTENYTYDNPDLPMQVSSKTVTDSKGEDIKTDYTYPRDYPNDPIFEHLGSLIGPIDERTLHVPSGQELGRTLKVYDFFGPPSVYRPLGNMLLKEIRMSYGGAPLETETIAERYDERGNVLQRRDRGGRVISYIYGYGNSLPVARVVGATYDVAVALVSQTFLNTQHTDDAALRSHLSALHTGLPNAQVTTYTFKPGVGMSSETDPRGITVHYEYDSYQRLKTVKDDQGRIQKSYDYNIKHQ